MMKATASSFNLKQNERKNAPLMRSVISCGSVTILSFQQALPLRYACVIFFPILTSLTIPALPCEVSLDTKVNAAVEYVMRDRTFISVEKFFPPNRINRQNYKIIFPISSEQFFANNKCCEIGTSPGDEYVPLTENTISRRGPIITVQVVGEFYYISNIGVIESRRRRTQVNVDKCGAIVYPNN